MNLWDEFDQRARRLGILETKLVQAAAIFFALVIVKLVPSVLSIEAWWFAALAVVCAARPAWVFFRPRSRDRVERRVS